MFMPQKQIENQFNKQLNKTNKEDTKILKVSIVLILVDAKTEKALWMATAEGNTSNLSPIEK